MPTSAVSFCRPMKSFSSGGITRRTACGSTTEASAWVCVRPSERAAASWLGCTDSMPARYTSVDVRRVDQDERDDAPEGVDVGIPSDRERGSAEAEQRDHEDRRHAAEEVGVDDGERANREEDRAGEARSTASKSAVTRMIASAITKIFTLSRNAREIAGKDSRYLVPVEERLPHLGPVRRVRDDVDEPAEEDDRAQQGEGDGAPCAAAPENARAPAAVQGATSGPARP